MVPVPEELAPRVIEYVSWKGHPARMGASEPEGDPGGPPAKASRAAEAGGDPIARALARLDQMSRRLVMVVAVAALEQQELTVPAAARRAGLSTREAIGTILELNNLIIDEGGPPMAVLIRGLEGAADDAFSWDRRILMTSEPIARSVAELARDPAQG